MVDLFIDLVALFLFFVIYKYIYIFFFPFSLFVSVYVYASLCDFVCIGLLLTFLQGFCLSSLFFRIVFKCLLSLVDLFINLVALFFLFFITF